MIFYKNRKIDNILIVDIGKTIYKKVNVCGIIWKNKTFFFI